MVRPRTRRNGQWRAAETDWGNDELEYYTPRHENVRLENGNLVIEAVKANLAGPDGVKRRYTSGRLTDARAIQPDLRTI